MLPQYYLRVSVWYALLPGATVMLRLQLFYCVGATGWQILCIAHSPLSGAPAQPKQSPVPKPVGRGSLATSNIGDLEPPLTD